MFIGKDSILNSMGSVVQLILVKSSNIKSIGFVPIKDKIGTLTIEFNSLDVYDYFDVTQEIFDGIMADDSKGKYHNLNIRGKFRYDRRK